MERIKLPKSCKCILQKIRNKQYFDIPNCDREDLLFLEHEGLVDVKWTEFGDAIIANLSEKGVAYLHTNPRLKNPSIFEDRKYVITTIISIIALVVATFALFKN